MSEEMTVTRETQGAHGTPSWKTVLGKALWTGVIAPPLVPIIYAIGIGIVFLVSRGFRDVTWPPEHPLTLYLVFFVVPAGSYLIGLLPALATGAILGWCLPRIAALWQRVGVALLTGAVSTIPVSLMWNNPPPMRSPILEFGAIGAVSALLTLPILHRRRKTDKCSPHPSERFETY